MLRKLVSIILLGTLINCIHSVQGVDAQSIYGTVTHKPTGQVVTIVEDFNRETNACSNPNLMGFYTVIDREPIVVLCTQDEGTLIHELTHAEQDLRDGVSDMNLVEHPNIKQAWNNLESINHPLIQHIKEHYNQSRWLVELEAYLSEVN